MGTRKRKSLQFPSLEIDIELKPFLVTAAKKCKSLSDIGSLLKPFRNEIVTFIEQIQVFTQISFPNVKQAINRTRKIREIEDLIDIYVSDCKTVVIPKPSVSKMLSMYYTGSLKNESDYTIAYLFLLSENPISYCFSNFLQDFISDQLTQHTLSLCSDMCKRRFLVTYINKSATTCGKVLYKPQINYATPTAYFGYIYNSKDCTQDNKYVAVFFQSHQPTICNCSLSIEKGRIFNQTISKENIMGLAQCLVVANSSKEKNSVEQIECILTSMQLISKSVTKDPKKKLNSSFQRLWEDQTNELRNVYQPTSAIRGNDLTGGFLCSILFGVEINSFSHVLNILVNNLNATDFEEMLENCSITNTCVEVQRILKYFCIKMNVFERNAKGKKFICTSYSGENKHEKEMNIFVWKESLFGLVEDSKEKVICMESTGSHLNECSSQVISESKYQPSYVTQVFRDLQEDLVRNDAILTQDIALQILNDHKLLNDHELLKIICKIQKNNIGLPIDKSVNGDFDSFLVKHKLNTKFNVSGVDENDSILTIIGGAVGIRRLDIPLLRVLVLYELLTNLDFYTLNINMVNAYKRTKKLTKTDLLYHAMQLCHDTKDKYADLPPVLFILSRIVKRNITLFSHTNTNESMSCTVIGFLNHERENICILSAFGTYFLLVPKNDEPMAFEMTVDKKLLTLQMPDSRNESEKTNKTVTKKVPERCKISRKKSADNNDTCMSNCSKSVFMQELGLKIVNDELDEFQQRCSSDDENNVENDDAQNDDVQNDVQNQNDDVDEEVIATKENNASSTSCIVFDISDLRGILPESEINASLELVASLEFDIPPELDASLEVDVSPELDGSLECLENGTGTTSLDENSSESQHNLTETTTSTQITSHKSALLNVDDNAREKQRDKDKPDKQTNIVWKLTRVCYDCKVKFASSKELGLHMSSVHGRPILRCLFCPSYCTSTKMRQRHMKREHKNELKNLVIEEIEED